MTAPSSIHPWRHPNLKRLLAILALATVLTALLATPAAGATDDPHFAKQWHLPRIGAEQAWTTATGGSALVAIVDSGVDLTHPDLAANVISYPDADMVEPDGTCSGKPRTCTQDGAQDKNGHGTHVAGIVAAAANNGVGGAGVAPGAKILPVRVLDANGEGTVEQVAAGINYAAGKGAKVINLSLGFLSGQGQALRAIGLLDPIEDAINDAWSSGAVIVVAAGNDTFPLCASPADYPNVVCVGATDQFDLIANYSNSDAIHPNYVTAPGGWSIGYQLSLGYTSPTGQLCSGEIFSTYLRGNDVWCSPEDGYEGISGTSMAAPMVSGVAALLAGRGLTNQQIVDCIKASTDDLGAPGRDPIYGFGRVNAANAVGC